MKTNIYILKLANNKYYIGKSSDPEKRFIDHKSGFGSNWTRIHKPISIEKIISNVSSFDEDKYVKEYMAKYGIDNVRGGTYVTEYLNDTDKKLLQKEIWVDAATLPLCGLGCN